MSLRPLRTVSRRGDWRARLPFWDRETFQSYTVAPTGQAGDAVVSFALFRDGEPDHCRWLRDYGWGRGYHHDRWVEDCGGALGRHHIRRPILNVFTDDGTDYLRLADGGISALLSIPQAIMAQIHEGPYFASLAAAYGDGSVIDLGADLVRIEGPVTPTAWHGPRMAGGAQAAGSAAAINDVLPYSIPILPGAIGAEVMAAVALSRVDQAPDAN